MVFGDPTTRLLSALGGEKLASGTGAPAPCVPSMSASCLRQSTHLTVERKNTVIKHRTSRTQCYQRPHCLYTLSLLPCKSLPSTEGENRRSLFSEKLREECFGLYRKYKAKKQCLYRRLDPTGTATVAWGPVILASGFLVLLEKAWVTIGDNIHLGKREIE